MSLGCLLWLQSVIPKQQLLWTSVSHEAGNVPGFLNQMSSAQREERIETMDKRITVFVGDMNPPKLISYGAQALVELLRQFQAFGGMYDRENHYWKGKQVRIRVVQHFQML